jgi:hypothetical protein
MKHYHSRVSANAAMSWLAGGMLLVFVEFCRPGWVVFGVAGGVMAVVGGYHLALRGMLWGLLGLALCWAGLALAAFGVWPRWLGWAASVALPLLCWRMDAHPAILVPLIGATWWLLGIAGRALQNKSGLN